MNAVTEQKAPQRVTVDQYAAQVLPPEKKSTVLRSLPQHIRPEVFERNVVNAIMANPDLMQYHPSLLFREVSKAAALGILLDPQLGEGYVIDVWNYKTKRKEPQFRPGYRGLMKLARQSGEVAQLYAHEVCQGDYYEMELGAEKKMVHKPNIFGGRGAVIGFYAVVKYRDGTFDFEPMSIDEIHKIRDRSEAWKAYKENKIKSTPWSTDENEMAKKTVIRRLVKRIQQSPEMADAIRYDEEDYPSGPPTITQALAQRMEDPPAPPPMIEDNSAPRNDPQDDPPPPGDDEAPSQTSGDPVDDQEEDLSAELADFEAFAKKVRSEESLDKEWDKWMARLEKLSRADRERLQAAYEAAGERIAKNAAKKAGTTGGVTGQPPTNEPEREDGKPPMAAKHEEERAAMERDPEPPGDDDPPPPADDDPNAAPEPEKPAGPMPSQQLRDDAVKRADKGSRRFSLWYRSLSKDDQAAIDTIGAELRPIIDAADAEIKAAEQG